MIAVWRRKTGRFDLFDGVASSERLIVLFSDYILETSFSRATREPQKATTVLRCYVRGEVSEQFKRPGAAVTIVLSYTVEARSRFA